MAGHDWSYHVYQAMIGPTSIRRAFRHRNLRLHLEVCNYTSQIVYVKYSIKYDNFKEFIHI